MSVEEPVEVLVVGFGEVIGSAQEGEAGSEQVRFERWGTPIRVAALYLSAYQSEALLRLRVNVGFGRCCRCWGFMLREFLGLRNCRSW